MYLGDVFDRVLQWFGGYVSFVLLFWCLLWVCMGFVLFVWLICLFGVRFGFGWLVWSGLRFDGVSWLLVCCLGGLVGLGVLVRVCCFGSLF